MQCLQSGTDLHDSGVESLTDRSILSQSSSVGTQTQHETEDEWEDEPKLLQANAAKNGARRKQSRPDCYRRIDYDSYVANHKLIHKSGDHRKLRGEKKWSDITDMQAYTEDLEHSKAVLTRLLGERDSEIRRLRQDMSDIYHHLGSTFRKASISETSHQEAKTHFERADHIGAMSMADQESHVTWTTQVDEEDSRVRSKRGEKAAMSLMTDDQNLLCRTLTEELIVLREILVKLLRENQNLMLRLAEHSHPADSRTSAPSSELPESVIRAF